MSGCQLSRFCGMTSNYNANNSMGIRFQPAQRRGCRESGQWRPSKASQGMVVLVAVAAIWYGDDLAKSGDRTYLSYLALSY